MGQFYSSPTLPLVAVWAVLFNAYRLTESCAVWYGTTLTWCVCESLKYTLSQYQSKNTLQLPTINLNSTYLMPIGVYLIVTTTSVHSVNVWVKGGIFFYRCGWIPGLCAPTSREGILQAGSFRAHLLLLCKSGGILCLWWNYWMRRVCTKHY